MSMTFYTYRDDATQPIGSHGPLTELADMYHFGGPRTLDPTIEQEIAAGWFHGPNFANSNAMMVVRSLGYDTSEVEGSMSFDPVELRGRVTLARVIPPIDDSGIASSRHGNIIDCGVRPGYFASSYEGIAEVCEQAIAWGTRVVLA